MPQTTQKKKNIVSNSAEGLKKKRCEGKRGGKKDVKLGRKRKSTFKSTR